MNNQRRKKINELIERVEELRGLIEETRKEVLEEAQKYVDYFQSIAAEFQTYAVASNIELEKVKLYCDSKGIKYELNNIVGSDDYDYDRIYMVDDSISITSHKCSYDGKSSQQLLEIGVVYGDANDVISRMRRLEN